MADQKKIYGSDLNKEDKYTQAQLLYEQFICEMNRETIGFSTMFALLRSLEDKNNLAIKNTLMQSLFLCCNKSFTKAILHSSDEIAFLEPGGNDIKLFDTGYKIIKKQLNPKE